MQICQYEINAALDNTDNHVRRVRRRGAGMISAGIVVTTFVWVAVAGWFVVLYFDA